MYAERVLSGMRPTGSLHLGHFHGVLKNWVKLQHEYPCLFFVADWHALTTQYDDPHGISQSTWEMVIDWLAAGVDRVVMLLCGAQNLREITLVPMNQRAEDPLMGAPSEASIKQLRELHLKLNLPN